MIAAIERAMIARLEAVAASGVLPFPKWRTATTYPDNWEDYLASQTKIATPAVYVVFAGWDAPEEFAAEGSFETGGVNVQGTFGVMVVDESLRDDEQHRRHGGPDPAKEPGTYNLIVAAVMSLAGQDLDLLTTPLELGALRPVSPTAESKARKLSRWSAVFTCRFALSFIGDLDDLDAPAIEQLHANWDIPAFGQPIAIDRDLSEPGVQLPDDRHADATDIVTLSEPEV